MTKQSGMGDRFYLGGFDVSGDFVSFDNISTSAAVLEGVTGIDKLAMERLPGLKDGEITGQCAFNDAAGMSFQQLKAVPTSDVLMTYAKGVLIGNAAACCVAKQVNMDATRGDDGSFLLKMTGSANGYGLEWANMLTAGVRVDTTATNGASYDTAVSLNFGLQAYLHVFAITGTSVTVKLQDSADNSTFADIAGATFAAAPTAGTWQRIQTTRTQTVRRYIRVATTGTFTSASFWVGMTKNPATVVNF